MSTARVILIVLIATMLAALTAHGEPLSSKTIRPPTCNEVIDAADKALESCAKLQDQKGKLILTLEAMNIEQAEEIEALRQKNDRAINPWLMLGFGILAGGLGASLLSK